MDLWLCRDEDGLLNLFIGDIPHKKMYEGIVVWDNDGEYGTIAMDKDYPNVTYENSPMKVEINLMNEE